MKQESGRAQRFALQLPVLYRQVGEKQWHEGQMENISRSGILLWTREPPSIDTLLEMSFVLPVGSAPPGIVCRGHIVRTVLPRAPHRLPGLAATISTYRFVRNAKAAV